MFEAYDPARFDQLNQFSAARRLLDENRDRIPCLGHVFIRHDLYDTFGLTLLHKHFSLSTNEFILRTADVEHRISHLHPEIKYDEAVPYLWKASAAKRGQWQFCPLEFAGGDLKEYLKPLEMEKAAGFLCELAETLGTLNLIDVFGVVRRDINQLPLGDDELLLETTDATIRLLTVKPELRRNVKMEELTETSWIFTRQNTSADADASLVCKGQHCSGHCNSHCRGHCSGHCIDHAPVPEPPPNGDDGGDDGD
jgi:hypothetical protein